MERGTEDSTRDGKREEERQKEPKIKDKRLMGCYKSFLIGCWDAVRFYGPNII